MVARRLQGSAAGLGGAGRCQRACGLKVGDKLGFRFFGREIEAEVASIRKVDWGGFGAAMAFVLSPGTLEAAHPFHTAIVKIPPAKEDALIKAVADRWPGVLDLPAAPHPADRRRPVRPEVSLVVTVLAGVVTLAGVLVLFGAFAAAARKRRRESALLKTFGASRPAILALYAFEFALAGLAAAVLGTGMGVLAAHPIVINIIEAQWRFALKPVLTVAVNCGAGFGGAGRRGSGLGDFVQSACTRLALGLNVGMVRPRSVGLTHALSRSEQLRDKILRATETESLWSEDVSAGVGRTGRSYLEETSFQTFVLATAALAACQTTGGGPSGPTARRRRRRSATSTPGLCRSGCGPDGKHPDLNGVWQVLNVANYNIEAHPAQSAMQLRPGPYVPVPDARVVALGAIGAVPAGVGIVQGDGKIPYTADALKTRDENRADWIHRDPEIKCYLPGIPRANYMQHMPFQIFQSDSAMFFAYEYAGAVRNVFLKDPGEAPVDSWMGQSFGKWDGDTFVIEVTGLGDGSWLDRAGNFHSSSMKVTERWTPTSDYTMRYEATIEDAATFTKPWKIAFNLYKLRRRRRPAAAVQVRRVRRRADVRPPAQEPPAGSGARERAKPKSWARNRSDN